MCKVNDLHLGGSWESSVKVELKLELRKEIVRNCLARHLKEIHISRSEKVKPQCGRSNLKLLPVILDKC